MSEVPLSGTFPCGAHSTLYPKPNPQPLHKGLHRSQAAGEAGVVSILYQGSQASVLYQQGSYTLNP